MGKVKIGLKIHNLLYLQIITMFITRFIQNSFHLQYVVYINDIITIMILGLLIIQYKGKIKLDITILILFEIIFWVFSYILEGNGNVVGFIYQFRILGRFFVVFIAAKETWKEKQYLKLFKIFDVIFFIHFLLSIIQIFLLNVEERDAIGGVFGVSYGYGNGAAHLLLIVVVIIAIHKYLEKQEPLLYSVIKVFGAVLLSLGTEMKSFIFEVAIIVLVMVVTRKKFDFRTIILLAYGGALGIWMASLYIQQYRFDVFDIQGISNYLNSGYGFNQEGIGRTNGFKIVTDRCFKGNISKIIWGLGFSSSGSDYAKMMFGGMNLENFTYAQLFYEVGVFGLVLYYVPFLLGIIKSVLLIKRGEILGRIGLCISIIGVYWTFYSSIMQADVGGYIFYLLLGIAYLKVEKNNYVI